MKKKRSAKQLANDKKLGRMAKARAKKKRGGRHKVAKRKPRRKNTLRRRQTAIQRATNPHRKKRKVSAKSHLWNVFKCRGNTVIFLAYSLGGKPAWTKDRGKAIVFKASGQAKRYAEDISGMRGYTKYQLGAVSQTMTSAQIAAGCRGKA